QFLEQLENIVADRRHFQTARLQHVLQALRQNRLVARNQNSRHRHSLHSLRLVCCAHICRARGCSVPINARVYGCSGASKTVRVSANSTIRPSRRIATRSQKSATETRSCEI